MDAEILRELVQIKWLIAALVTGVLSLAAIRIWIDVRRTGGPRELFRREFAQRAKLLLDEGRAGELLNLSEARLQEVPADAFAFWYHAHAAYRLGDISMALTSIKKVGELKPDWRETHVEPFIRALSAGSPDSDKASWPTPSLSDHGPSKPH